jgi:hypothetical protein
MGVGRTSGHRSMAILKTKIRFTLPPRGEFVN